MYEENLDRISWKKCLISDVLTSEPCDVVCIRGKGARVFVMDPFGVTTEIGKGEVNIIQAFNFIWEKQPMILCRTNKQVKAIEELRYYQVSTVHQAKGL
jgi:hypothetical protein